MWVAMWNTYVAAAAKNEHAARRGRGGEGVAAAWVRGIFRVGVVRWRHEEAPTALSKIVAPRVGKLEAAVHEHAVPNDDSRVQSALDGLRFA